MVENYAMGAIKSNIDVRNYQLTKTSINALNFPKEFALPMPEAKSQGSVCSCVAHAASIIVEYFNMVQVNDSSRMSTGFIYGNRDTLMIPYSKGMTLFGALEALRHDGDVKQDDFPQNIEMPQAQELFKQYYPALKDKAQAHCITGYYFCPTKEAIKAALMKDGPVMIAVPWRPDIHLKDDGYTFDTEQKWFDITGGHCMVIYGWNEKGWLVQNSWGKDWGKDGRCLIPYKIRLSEAWGVIDTNIDNRTDIKKPFSSELGNTIAKVINAIINGIINLFKKKQ